MKSQTNFVILTGLLFGIVFILSSGNVLAQKKQVIKQVNKFAKLDTNKDGKISKEEFLTYSQTEFNTKDANKDGKITKDECGKFDKLNKDGNDFVSKNEFLKGHENMFMKMDVDKNGKISKEEFATFQTAIKKEGKCGKSKMNKIKYKK